VCVNSLSTRLRLLTDCAAWASAVVATRKSRLHRNRRKSCSRLFLFFVFYCACVRTYVRLISNCHDRTFSPPSTRCSAPVIKDSLLKLFFLGEQGNIFNTHWHTHTCPLKSRACNSGKTVWKRNSNCILCTVTWASITSPIILFCLNQFLNHQFKSNAIAMRCNYLTSRAVAVALTAACAVS